MVLPSDLLLAATFMLKATTDPLFDPSRTACLQATRQLLKIYNTLRQNATPSSYTCKCEDFQGLFASIVLIVGLLQYSSQGIELVGGSFDQDLELLDMTKRDFEFASTQQGGSIAKQGLHVINTLSTFLEDDLDSLNGAEQAVKSATLFIPYFGTILVQSGANIRRPNGTKKGEATTGVSMPILSSQGLRSGSLVGDQTQLNDETFFNGNGVNAFGGYPNHPGYGMPTDLQSVPCLVSQSTTYSNSTGFDMSVPTTFNNVSGSLFNWDKMMYGPELDQQWNYTIPDPTTSV
jgi:hypothetical protein